MDYSCIDNNNCVQTEYLKGWDPKHSSFLRCFDDIISRLKKEIIINNNSITGTTEMDVSRSQQSIQLQSSETTLNQMNPLVPERSHDLFDDLPEP